MFSGGYVTALYGGAGNDSLGGSLTGELLDGGAGDDVLFAKAGDHANANPIGETLLGGEGNDKLIFNIPRLINLLNRPSVPSGSALHVLFDGGMGDDLLVGASDASSLDSQFNLTGGAGDDTIYAYGNERITDAGFGHDTYRGSDRVTGTPAPDQTANFKVLYSPPISPSGPFSVQVGTGYIGRNSPIVVTGSDGTLTLRGRPGSKFTVGQFIRNIGDPFERDPSNPFKLLAFKGLPPFGLPVGEEFILTVNGVKQNDVLGYEIHNGDHLVLEIHDLPPF